MARVKVTNLIKLAALLNLYSRPMHGYELIKELGAKMGRSISASQVYPFLKLLSRNGYIKADLYGGRDKKRYALTSSGKEFVKSTMDHLGGIIDVAITNKISKCFHCGCSVYSGGFKKKVKGKSRIFCCKYCARGC